MTTAIIAAAGAGTRLGPLGTRSSKAMVPIVGRPLIDWVISRLRAAGIDRLIAVAHADDEALGDFLSSAHPDVGVAMQASRHGIADAICCALPRLAGDAAYLACACDSLFAAPEIAAMAASGRRQPDTAVVGVLEMPAGAAATRSAVRLAGERVVEIVEKPPPGHAPSALVAAPLYWLPRAVDAFLAYAPPDGGERYVSSALARFIAAGGVVNAARLSGRIEVTTAADVERAGALLSR